jgi:hypothetical protein
MNGWKCIVYQKRCFSRPCLFLAANRSGEIHEVNGK